jgi:hypothetical protein
MHQIFQTLPSYPFICNGFAKRTLKTQMLFINKHINKVNNFFSKARKWKEIALVLRTFSWNIRFCKLKMSFPPLPFKF